MYTVGSQKNLMQILESVAQKITIPGVIINFDKYGPDPEVLQEGKSGISFNVSYRLIKRITLLIFKMLTI